MNLSELIALEEDIYDLYFHVAKNAPFNTFLLPKNHFRVFKEKLQDNFLFYGYFKNGKLIGFNTLIKNGETFFLFKIYSKMRGSVLVFQGTMLAVTINHYVIYQRFQLKYFLIQIIFQNLRRTCLHLESA